jgi:transposase
MVAFGTLPAEFKEWRRFRALALSREGWKEVEIARALDVSRAAVCKWLAMVRVGGSVVLKARQGCGRPPRLTSEQWAQIPELLWHGAEAYGFRGEVWTCARIGKVFQEEFGVHYHPGHISRLLKKLGWTPQIPITRAIQRDEAAIERWRIETWPQLKQQARKERRTLVFTDESGFYLLPGMVKTYAPAGVTPLIREKQTRDHLSMMGAVTLQGRVSSLVKHKSVNGMHSIEFLDHLLRVVGDRLLVIWDGSPIHKRVAVREFVNALGAKIVLHFLPGYAPELNPVEHLWNHLKHVELRNLVCRDLEELHYAFHLAIERVRRRPRLVQSFFDASEL